MTLPLAWSTLLKVLTCIYYPVIQISQSVFDRCCLAVAMLFCPPRSVTGAVSWGVPSPGSLAVSTLVLWGARVSQAQTWGSAHALSASLGWPCTPHRGDSVPSVGPRPQVGRSWPQTQAEFGQRPVLGRQRSHFGFPYFTCSWTYMGDMCGAAPIFTLCVTGTPPNPAHAGS